MSEAWPVEIRLRDRGQVLVVEFDSGESLSYSAEFLRVESPSAEVKGHGPGQDVIVAGKMRVSIERIERVGNYAIRPIFSDGHATGIFTWPYLLDLGRDFENLWSRYLARLSERGLSRHS